MFKNQNVRKTIFIAAYAVVTGMKFVCLAQESSSPTAPWHAASTNLAPEISSTIKDEVRALMVSIKQHKPAADPRIPFHPDYEKAVLRLMELGEEAGKAVLWHYIEEPGDRGTTQTTYPRHEALQSIAGDPVLTSWTKPVLVERIKWIRQNLNARTLDRTDVSFFELGAMETFFVYQGTPQEQGDFYRLLQEIQNSDAELAKDFRKLVPKEEWMNENKLRVRDYSQFVLKPFHEQFRMNYQVIRSGKTRHEYDLNSMTAGNKTPDSVALVQTSASSVAESFGTARLIFGLLIGSVVCCLWFLRKRRA